MNKQILMIALSLLVFSNGFANALPKFNGQDWNPRVPLQFPNSFHSLLLSKDNNPVNSFVGAACVQAIRSEIDKGHSFFSPLLLFRYTLPIKDFPDSDTQDGSFYHYTNASEMEPVVSEGRYDDIFKYIRSNNDVSRASSWYLYIASDRKSSHWYGNYRAIFEISTDWLVFISAGGKPGQPQQSSYQIDQAIEKNLIERNPSLEACKGIWPSSSSKLDSRFHSVLTSLAIEATGVGLIAYMGVKNRVRDENFCDCNEAQWLQMVGPWVVDSSSFQKFFLF